MLWLAACQHGGVLIKETPMGLGDIRRIVSTVTGEPRILSPNGYEMTSVYFDRKEKPIEHPNDAKERFYTKVSILGDRRPYDIRVQVFVELRTPEGFENIGQDDDLAEMWADKITKALHDSRDKRNFIDDFKAF